MRALHEVEIKGFKSIKEAKVILGNLNVIIGANGSGKTNFIDIFRIINHINNNQLQSFIPGDPDRFLHHGRKVTKEISCRFSLENKNEYSFTLEVNKDSLVFVNERLRYVDLEGSVLPAQGVHSKIIQSKGDNSESILGKEGKFSNELKEEKLISSLLKKLVVYHFHDASDDAPAKRMCNIDDNSSLRPDGSNLSAYLYWLQEKHPEAFRHIEEHVRLVAPFFSGFDLKPSRLNENKIKLEWRHKESDAYFDAYSLSDGTLRFICLATLLLQPEPPNLILIDEPELGLHPHAIRILVEMLEAASVDSQVIISTQSVTLLDNFFPENVIIAECNGKETSFKRLNEEDLKHWLDRFSVGELWKKNVIGGNP
ncbi:AAA family ATPase [Azospirillaceae bacterium]